MSTKLGAVGTQPATTHRLTEEPAPAAPAEAHAAGPAAAPRGFAPPVADALPRREQSGFSGPPRAQVGAHSAAELPTRGRPQPAPRTRPNPDVSPLAAREAALAPLRAREQALTAELTGLTAQAATMAPAELGARVQDVSRRLADVKAELAAVPQVPSQVVRDVGQTVGGKAAQAFVDGLDPKYTQPRTREQHQAFLRGDDPSFSRADLARKYEAAVSGLSPHDRLDFDSTLTGAKGGLSMDKTAGSLGISDEVRKGMLGTKHALRNETFGDPAARETFFRNAFGAGPVDSALAAAKGEPDGVRSAGLMVGLPVMGENGVLTSHLQATVNDTSKAGIVAEGWVTYNRDGTVDFTKWDPKYPAGGSGRERYGIWTLERD